MMKWNETNLLRALTAAEVALWSWNVDTDKIVLDELGCEMWGVPEDREVTFEDLSAQIFPHDLDRVREAFAATRTIEGHYEIDFRITVGSRVSWVSARGQGSDVDIVGRNMLGVFLDVTARKRAEEANELLAGEMSHRVKNLLAIASALATITAHSSATAVEMSRDLGHRLTALGRAHDLVRPAPGQKVQAALLGELFSVLLAPYDETGAFVGRIRVSVPRLEVGETAATNLALVVHELATNSIKYGALSTKTGTLDVSCVEQDGEAVVAIWTERGGPPVAESPTPGGFGSKLLARSMAGLGGSLETTWDGAGVVVTLRMTRAALVA
ncbi:histidine kinase [Siculibacillus lacustris]|uniref:histidine kinase n=1 Tax=Siculibacillus lacustris TaxID=1549641 RepID=A0A4Q9VWV6_9HYPH|nr:HWE histidine kinase domain-containing protein [Siculibacillus lacustris]TBW40847.1 histidine kinase [Siculibacillus lacustris]